MARIRDTRRLLSAGRQTTTTQTTSFSEQRVSPRSSPDTVDFESLSPEEQRTAGKVLAQQQEDLGRARQTLAFQEQKLADKPSAYREQRVRDLRAQVQLLEQQITTSQRRYGQNYNRAVELAPKNFRAERMKGLYGQKGKADRATVSQAFKQPGIYKLSTGETVISSQPTGSIQRNQKGEIIVIKQGAQGRNFPTPPRNTYQPTPGVDFSAAPPPGVPASFEGTEPARPLYTSAYGFSTEKGQGEVFISNTPTFISPQQYKKNRLEVIPSRSAQFRQDLGVIKTQITPQKIGSLAARQLPVVGTVLNMRDLTTFDEGTTISGKASQFFETTTGVPISINPVARTLVRPGVTQMGITMRQLGESERTEGILRENVRSTLSTEGQFTIKNPEETVRLAQRDTAITTGLTLTGGLALNYLYSFGGRAALTAVGLERAARIGGPLALGVVATVKPELLVARPLSTAGSVFGGTLGYKASRTGLQNVRVNDISGFQSSPGSTSRFVRGTGQQTLELTYFGQSKTLPVSRNVVFRAGQGDLVAPVDVSVKPTQIRLSGQTFGRSLLLRSQTGSGALFPQEGVVVYNVGGRLQTVQVGEPTPLVNNRGSQSVGFLEFNNRNVVIRSLTGRSLIGPGEFDARPFVAQKPPQSLTRATLEPFVSQRSVITGRGYPSDLPQELAFNLATTGRTGLPIIRGGQTRQNLFTQLLNRRGNIAISRSGGTRPFDPFFEPTSTGTSRPALAQLPRTQGLSFPSSLPGGITSPQLPFIAGFVGQNNVGTRGRTQPRITTRTFARPQLQVRELPSTFTDQLTRPTTEPRLRIVTTTQPVPSTDFTPLTEPEPRTRTTPIIDSIVPFTPNIKVPVTPFIGGGPLFGFGGRGRGQFGFSKTKTRYSRGLRAIEGLSLNGLRGVKRTPRGGLTGFEVRL